jgi:putative ABC transport system ATP-binding protein
MQDAERIIEIQAITKNFGQSTVLNNVNLMVKQSEFVAIRGKSGVGKSTLLKILGLLETPDAGGIRLFGKDITKLNDGQRSELRLKNIGFAFQFFNLLPSLTVSENIELPLSLAGVKKNQRKQRITELLNYFQLEHLAERSPENLSGGEKQRIAIIRALSNNPKILILDEPTSSIDDENTELLMNLLTSINKNQDLTIIMTTTDLYEKYPTTQDLLLKDAQLQQAPLRKLALPKNTVKL